MKNILLILSIICFLLASCKQKNPLPNPQIGAKLSADTTCNSYHKITFDSACQLISDFVKDTTLGVKADKFAIGGYIPAPESILRLFSTKTASIDSIPSNNPAFRFFPCFDYKVTGSKVFMAYKYEENYNANSGLQCDLRNDDKLLKSNSDFNFKKNSPNDLAAIAEFIANNDKISEKSDTIYGIDAKIFSYDFLTEYTDDSGQGNQSNCGGFFKCAIDSIFNQRDEKNKAVIGMRFFFGYNKARNCNKIRLILMPVVEDGTVMITRANHTPAYMIERNWPPECN